MFKIRQFRQGLASEVGFPMLIRNVSCKAKSFKGFRNAHICSTKNQQRFDSQSLSVTSKNGPNFYVARLILRIWNWGFPVVTKSIFEYFLWKTNFYKIAGWFYFLPPDFGFT
jgi:hypothetical protein